MMLFVWVIEYRHMRGTRTVHHIAVAPTLADAIKAMPIPPGLTREEFQKLEPTYVRHAPCYATIDTDVAVL